MSDVTVQPTRDQPMTDHDRMNYWWRRATEAEAEVKRLSWKCGHLADKYAQDTDELRQEAGQAEARIKAVRDALDGWDDIQPPAFHQLADEIRHALDGDQ